MEALIERACGLDVHEAFVVASLLTGPSNARPTRTRKTFGTTRAELLALRDWLKAAGCTHVAMESTGIYWRPIYETLEAEFDVTVGNARHIKNVPGRKTDVTDADWIADLLRHGLIRKSFVPPPPLRELREVLRYRRSLVETRAAERNRVIKLLECAGIKLANVVSDVFGVSGMAILRALIEGRAAPAEMAQLAKGRLRPKRAALAAALDGQLTEQRRFLLEVQLHRLEGLDQDIAILDQRIAEMLQPYAEAHARLITIPGVDVVAAATIIAEIGTDMAVFTDAAHLAAWAGVCPGNHASAGRQRGAGCRRGNLHLKTALVGAAKTAVRTKGSYWKAKYHKLKARRGALRATLAIAHKILVAAYHMLATNQTYRDLGEDHLNHVDQKRAARRLVQRLESLGYEVVATPKAA